jgi:GNAT superfamily N-acetyltransferase
LAFRLSYATSKDLDLLVAHRLNMWRDIHPELGSKIDESTGATRRWVREKLRRGELVGFVVRTTGGKVAGSGCVWIREEQPRPTNPLQKVPYLLSMYTEEEFRRRGVARMIVKRALKWCRAHHYDRLTLHASTQGRILYESLGFETTQEMRIKL